eukprot:4052042-Amphidinium_carterae.1
MTTATCSVTQGILSMGCKTAVLGQHISIISILRTVEQYVARRLSVVLFFQPWCGNGLSEGV